jgi:hypothetical protein
MVLFKKKASLPLNYVFLIFVSVIAVFVIVGMLSQWTFSANKFMCKLTGDCDETMLLDKQTITVENDPVRFVNEIVKHAKICYERARKGEVKGELCYTVKCETTTGPPCVADEAEIDAEIGTTSWESKINRTEFSISNKAIIEFDYSKQIVKIK